MAGLGACAGMMLKAKGFCHPGQPPDTLALLPAARCCYETKHCERNEDTLESALVLGNEGSQWPPGCAVPAPLSPSVQGSSEVELRAVSRSRSLLSRLFLGIPLFHPLCASPDAVALLPLFHRAQSRRLCCIPQSSLLHSSTFSIIFYSIFILFHLPWQLHIP